MDQERIDVISKKTGAVIATFDMLEDAELFLAGAPGDGLEIVDTNPPCPKPMNLFLSQGGLVK